MRPALAVLTTLAALAAPAGALADSADVIRDCQDGSISGKYSQQDFSSALRNIPTDVDEYTDCRDVIRRAQLGAAGGSAAGGGAGGLAPGGRPAAGGSSAAQLIEAASPTERAALTKAIEQTGDAPVTVGGRIVDPATAGVSPGGAANVVPTPLVVALVLLALGLVLGGAQSIRSRVLGRRAPAV